MELYFEKLSGFAKCRFGSNIYWSHIPEFSYTFKPGTYALLGGIDNGGWAVSYGLAPLRQKDVHINKWAEDGISESLNISKFYLDGQEVSLDYLQKISHNLGKHQTKSKHAACNKPAIKQITKAIKRGTSKYSLEELKERLGLTDDRLKIQLNRTGNEGWRLSTAVGLAQGKKIFCLPWRSNRCWHSLTYAISKMAEVIKESGGILLFPVENDKLVKNFVDDIIDLSQPQIFGGEDTQIKNNSDHSVNELIKKTKEAFMVCIEQAKNNPNNAWPDYLSDFFENPRLSQIFTRDFIDTLRKYYNDFGRHTTQTSPKNNSEYSTGEIVEKIKEVFQVYMKTEKNNQNNAWLNKLPALLDNLELSKIFTEDFLMELKKYYQNSEQQVDE